MVRNKFLTKKTIIFPDLKFNSYLIQLLINSAMKNGKKSLIEDLVYNALKDIHIKTKQNPLKIFEIALKNLQPKFKIIDVKIKGIKSNTPVELPIYLQIKTAIKWLLESLKQRNEKSFSTRLANEIIDASKYIGNAIKKRDQIYKQIEANKVDVYDNKQEIINKE